MTTLPQRTGKKGGRANTKVQSLAPATEAILGQQCERRVKSAQTDWLCTSAASGPRTARLPTPEGLWPVRGRC